MFVSRMPESDLDFIITVKHDAPGCQGMWTDGCQDDNIVRGTDDRPACRQIVCRRAGRCRYDDSVSPVTVDINVIDVYFKIDHP